MVCACCCAPGDPDDCRGVGGKPVRNVARTTRCDGRSPPTARGNRVRKTWTLIYEYRVSRRTTSQKLSIPDRPYNFHNVYYIFPSSRLFKITTIYHVDTCTTRALKWHFYVIFSGAVEDGRVADGRMEFTVCFSILYNSGLFPNERQRPVLCRRQRPELFRIFGGRAEKNGYIYIDL